MKAVKLASPLCACRGRPHPLAVTAPRAWSSTTVTRESQQQRNTPTRGKGQDWVPEAYRGIPATNGSGGGNGGSRQPPHRRTRPPPPRYTPPPPRYTAPTKLPPAARDRHGNTRDRHPHHNKKRPPRPTGGEWRVRNKGYARHKAAAAALLQDWENLLGVSQEVSRLARRYRQVCGSPDDGVAAEASSAHVTAVFWQPSPEDLGLAALKTEVVKLSDALREVVLIHQDDGGHRISAATLGSSLPQEERQRLMASENLFRGLCRGIQDLAQASCKMYRHEAMRPTLPLVDLAELALLTLAEIRADRALLFQQLDESSSDSVVAKDEADVPASPATPSSSSSSSWLSSFSGLASYLSESISKITKSKTATASSKETMLTTLAHEDPSLDPSLASFRMVVGSIALASMDATTAKELEEPEKRVVQLLQVLPADVTPDSRSLLNVLEILCHAGSLEAARECRRLFEEYSYAPQVTDLGFSLVLRAYLEAGRNETDANRQALVVQEILGVFQERWDEHLPPRHRAERIAQGSSVLHCLAVSGSSDDVRAKDAAGLIVRRTLGSDAFNILHETITTAKGKVEGQTVHLVNFMARFYAKSSQAKNVNLAKDMVRCILPQENDASGQYIKYPNVETINTLLERILCLHQEGTEEMDGEADLAFSDELLKFAMSRREAGIWPNEETFRLLIVLYTWLRPRDVGKRMEKLLSNYEARVYFSPQSEMKVPRTAYNRALWALRVEAEEDEPRRASSRALAILDKLEMLSTPLLLSRKEALVSKDISLYDFDLLPNHEPFINVLNVCAFTGSSEEFELAASVAHEVGGRLLKNSNNGLGKKTWEKLRVCMKRLAPDSPNRDRLKALLGEMQAAHKVHEEVKAAPKVSLNG
jgi:hypothetical protein